MRERDGFRVCATALQTRAALDASAAHADAGGPTLQPLLTVGEVASMLRVSSKTVQRFVAMRSLPCVRIGRRVRFLAVDVLRFVAARKD